MCILEASNIIYIQIPSKLPGFMSVSHNTDDDFTLSGFHSPQLFTLKAPTLVSLHGR